MFKGVVVVIGNLLHIHFQIHLIVFSWVMVVEGDLLHIHLYTHLNCMSRQIHILNAIGCRLRGSTPYPSKFMCYRLFDAYEGNGGCGGSTPYPPDLCPVGKLWLRGVYSISI